MPIPIDIPDPEVLDLDDEEIEDIGQYVKEQYSDRIHERSSFDDDHEKYDQMFRGQVERFNPRDKPWDNAANLHVQAPYWLVDSINVRLVGSIWNQVPLVGCEWSEPSDQKIAKLNAGRVEWHLKRRQSRAREIWNRASKIRLIHGNSVIQVSHVKDEHKVRELNNLERPEFSDDGILSEDDRVATPQLVTKTKYEGLTYYPFEWDDVLVPHGAGNLQPLSPSNPLGSDIVITRRHQRLSYMLSMVGLPENPGDYAWMLDGDRDEEWWNDHAPTQDDADTTGDENQNRERQQREMEGLGSTSARTGMNPKFEILTAYMPWDLGEGLEECIFFVCRKPLVVLGGYRLSDVVWNGKRPLVEMQYQTVSNRYHAMGVCEIVRFLSEELDTIHNMRIDVGQATNLPWFFYKSNSNFRPQDIKLAPMKGVPIDELDDVRFSPVQNVTGFYFQEETLLLSLIERVMGVTDLFLGVSPTHGAAARHATGFQGTQQEAFARLSEIQNQDAESFANLCDLIYALDWQYGPEERGFRLTGEIQMHEQDLRREDLRFRGEYDFRLGANQGTYSQQAKVQKAQAVLQLAGTSPLINMALTRRWEAEANYLRGIGLTEREMEAVIGTKEATGATEPKDQETENNEMIQFMHGPGVPSSVHPNDDDMDHLRLISELRTGAGREEYDSLGRPNEQALVAHAQMHEQQLAAKQQQQMMMQMMPQNGMSGIGQGQGANPMNRAQGQLNNVPEGGSGFGEAFAQSMGATPAIPGMNGQGQP